MDLKRLANNPFTYIILASPFILYYLLKLNPIFDDWTYFTVPDYDYGGNFLKNLAPQLSYWRPFDVLFGLILSLDSDLFPALNHVMIYLGHLGCTFLTYKLSNTLGFSRTASNIATIFFFISPATLGTVLGVDSLNQTYSQLWCLAGTWAYLSLKGRKKTAIWLVCVTIATLVKESGIMFFIIPQMLAYAVKKHDLRRLATDTAIAAGVAAAYILARILLSDGSIYINDGYFINTKIKNISVLISMIWTPFDFIYLWYKPDKNPLMVALTLAMTLPFVIFLFASNIKNAGKRMFITLILAFFTAALPNILTLLTSMHAYCALGVAALLVAYLADNVRKRKILYPLLCPFVISVVYTDAHHWHKTYQSGMKGEVMAKSLIKKLGKPTDSIYVISMYSNEARYSMFCVTANDAFCDGNALQHATGYRWPKRLDYAWIIPEDLREIDSMADNAVKQGYEKVILIQNGKADVIR